MTNNEFYDIRNFLDDTRDYKTLKAGKYRCFIVDIDEHFCGTELDINDNEQVVYFVKACDVTVEVDKKTYELTQSLDKNKVVLLFFLYKRSAVLKRVFVPEDDYNSRAVTTSNGVEVSRGEVEPVKIDRGNVSADFVDSLSSAGKNRSLCDEQLDFLTVNIKRTQIYKETLFSYIAMIILTAVILIPICYILPLWVLFSSGEPDEIIVGIVYASLLTGGFALYFTMNRRGNKPAKSKIAALARGDYEVYYFRNVKKMRCGERVGRRYVSDFYLDCNGLVLQVSAAEYDLVEDSVYLVVIHYGRKTGLEVLAAAPDKVLTK